MKISSWMGWLSVVLVALALGCSAEHKVESDKLSQAFASATGETKTQADQAAAAIGTENFAGALAALDKLAQTPSLTAEQKQAIGDTLVDINVIVLEKSPTNSEALLKSIEEINGKL